MEGIPQPWHPWAGKGITSDVDHRRQLDLLRVLAQFDVATCERYQPKGKTTFCNIAVWDATTAMGVEIPHWYYPSSGEKAVAGYPLSREMTANDMQVWLGTHGFKFGGWREVEEIRACVASEKGQPAVVTWVNPRGPGHVAVLTPPHIDGPMLWQAGIVCSPRMSLTEAFSRDKLSALRYWAAP